MTISHCMFSVSSNSVLAAACEPAAPLPALWVTPSHGGKGSREARRCRVLHWRPGMPVGGLLVLMGHVQQARFAEIGTEQLHAYRQDRKSTRLNSSHVRISYAVFCWKKK